MSHHSNQLGQYFFEATDEALKYAISAFDLSITGQSVLCVDAPQTAALVNGENWLKMERLEPLKPSYDFIFINAGGHKIETAALLARMIKHLTPQGSIVIAGANDTGGKSIQKILTQFNLTAHEISKFKHRIYYIPHAGAHADMAALDIATPVGAVHKRPDGFYTMAGVFSWDRADVGSLVLLDALKPVTLAGRGADFGAGIGFLGVSLLTQNPSIVSLTSIELDVRAVECARMNLKPFGARSIIAHQSVLSYAPPSPLDFIIMNPPFHTGAKTAIGLGQDFILRAASVLKTGGELYLVANNALPYEKILHTHFKPVTLLAQNHGFKIIKAVKMPIG